MRETKPYSPVDSVEIAGFTLEDIQGKNATISTTPFRTGHIPLFSRIVTDVSPHSPDERDPLRRISKIHGRSYEVIPGTNKNVLWADDYGNIFMNLNTKGNNVSKPAVCRSDISPSGFVVFGMQESDTLVRVLTASELLRSHNIETEAVVKVIEPAELPHNGEFVAIGEFKRRLIEDVWKKDGFFLRKHEGFPLAKQEDIPAISKAFEKMTFYVTVRGTQVNERLADLYEAFDSPEVDIMLEHAFRYVNEYEKSKAKKTPGYEPKKFSVDSQKDIDEYFNDYLPRRLARNFAGIHKLGIKLDYTHSGNWSAIGSFYDLDSAKGEPLGLGDEPITIDDMLADVAHFVGHPDQEGFPSPDDVAVTLVKGVSTFNEAFLQEYIKEMGWADSLQGFKNISSLFVLIGDKRLQGVRDSYIDPLVRQTGLQPVMDRLIKRYIVDGQSKPVSDDADRSNEGLVRQAFEITGMKKILDGIASEVVQRYGKPPDEFTPEDIASIHTFSMSYTIQEAVKSLSSLLQFPSDRIFRLVFSGEIKESVSVLENYRYQTYVELAKRAGWEKSVCEHADDFYKLFCGFPSVQSLEYLEHYVHLVQEELGWEFRMPETIQDMIALFHEADQKKAKSVIENAIAQAPEGMSRKEVVEKVFESDEGTKEFSFDHKARYNYFVIDLVADRLLDERASEIASLHKFGDENAKFISYFIQNYAVHPYVDALPEGIEEQIIRESKDRINALVVSYLNTNISGSSED